MVPRRIGFLALFLISLALCSVSLRAQNSLQWTIVPTPSTATLWSVCHGEGLWVAVGEGGTIWTSPNATTWTPRTSGTSVWLVGVGYSEPLKRFVVVGDQGTILGSSDGITWTKRTAPTAERLNAVVYGDGVFLIVGERGTALTSADGESWTVRTTGTDRWLRGLDYGEGVFVAAGQDGVVVVSRDRGQTFEQPDVRTTKSFNAVCFTGTGFVATGVERVWAMTEGAQNWQVNSDANWNGQETDVVYHGLISHIGHQLTVGDRGRIRDRHGNHFGSEELAAHWRAIAADGVKAVVVGSLGTIAWTQLDLRPQYAVLQLRSQSRLSTDEARVPAGTQIQLRLAGYRLDDPADYEWQLNGQPVSAALGPNLDISNFGVTHVGRYQVKITTAAGSYETDLYLALHPGVPTTVDHSYRSPLLREPDFVLPLRDGRVYVVGGSFQVNGHLQRDVARLRRDGSIDPEFDVGEGIGLGGTILHATVGPDDGLVLFGRFTSVAAQAAPNVIALTHEGQRRPRFRPAPELLASVGHHLATPQTPRLEAVPILLADGRWLLAKDTVAPNLERTLTVTRFLADGTRDESYTGRELAVPSPAPVVRLDSQGVPLHSLPVASTDQHGRVYLATSYGGTYLLGLGAKSGQSAIHRLRPDGEPDGEWQPVIIPGDVARMIATPGAVVLVMRDLTYSRPNYNIYHDLVRIRASGEVDEAFGRIRAPGPDRLFSASDYAGFGSIFADPRGGILVETLSMRGRSGLIRFSDHGVFDPEFRLELADRRGAARAVLHDGSILAANVADFNESGPVPLQRVWPDRSAGDASLVNLSLRAQTGLGERNTIVGFVIKHGTLPLLARAAGPVLADLQVRGAALDPFMTLYQGDTAVGANDDWWAGGSSAAAQISDAVVRRGAFPFPPMSKDAAVWWPSFRGLGSVQVTDQSTGTGVVLVELYADSVDQTDAASPRLANLSGRGYVGQGDNTLIAGFAIRSPDGSASKVLIRAVGPTLRDHGINEALADPMLTLYRDQTAIGFNDNWTEPIREPMRLKEAFATVGAFPLRESMDASVATDAALLVTLPPGDYTAHVTSRDGSTGIALIEIYEVP